MTRSLLTALVAAAALGGGGGGGGGDGGAHQARRPRVALISVDGLWARDLQRAESAGVRLPVLDSLRRAGALAAGVVGSLPSVTYPSHTTIVTGVRPARHGIYSNHIFAPPTDTSRLDFWYWEADLIRVPTLFDVARAAGLSTAAVGWPATAEDAAVTYNLPEVWDPRAIGDSDLAVMRRRGTPWLLDSLGAPPTGPFTDSLRAEWTATIVRRWDPDLVALHLIDLDGAKHEHGPWAAPVITALGKIDRELGRVLAAVRATSSGRPTTVIVTSDHGFLRYDQVLRPGVLLVTAGLVRRDSAGTVTAWDAAVLANGGSVMILPHDPTDRSLAARVRRAIPDSLVGPGRPIRAVWPRDTIAGLGGDPRALWALDLNEGFYARGGYAGPLLSPRTGAAGGLGGGHGHDPRRPELHAFFLAAGAGIRPGTELPLSGQVDIAPTVARLLQLRMERIEGRPIR
jgi:predicted AlkP superfamily pyrophosphatase or phosphodiesterase